MAVRHAWIDWAKVIAIYLVILGHFIHKNNFENEFVVNWIYSFHMPFFFFISGYLFRIKETCFFDFVKRIFRSLILPYIGLNLISNLFLVPSWYLSGSGWTEQLFFFLTADAKGQSGSTWFLMALSWVWLMAYILLKLNVYIRILSILLSVLFAYYFPFHLWWRPDVAVAALPFFMSGFYFKEKCNTTRNSFRLLFFTIFYGGGKFDWNIS